MLPHTRGMANNTGDTAPTTATVYSDRIRAEEYLSLDWFKPYRPGRLDLSSVERALNRAVVDYHEPRLAQQLGVDDVHLILVDAWEVDECYAANPFAVRVPEDYDWDMNGEEWTSEAEDALAVADAAAPVSAFATMDDVLAYIAAAIEAGGAATRDEYDLDAIADKVAVWDPDRQQYLVSEFPDDTDDFWAAVEAAAL